MSNCQQPQAHPDRCGCVPHGTEQVSSAWLAQLREEYRLFGDENKRLTAENAAMAQRCREREEEARAPLCFCGLPMAKNPHPDAGKPDQLLEVGAVYVCIPCLNKANRGHAKSANTLRAEVDRLQAELAVAHSDASHYASASAELRDEVERLRILLKEWLDADEHKDWGEYERRVEKALEASRCS